MNLAELKEKSKAQLDVLATFLDGLHGDLLSMVGRIAGFVDTATGLVTRSNTFADSPPPPETRTASATSPTSTTQPPHGPLTSRRN